MVAIAQPVILSTSLVNLTRFWQGESCVIHKILSS